MAHAREVVYSENNITMRISYNKSTIIGTLYVNGKIYNTGWCMIETDVELEEQIQSAQLMFWENWKNCLSSKKS